MPDSGRTADRMSAGCPLNNTGDTGASVGSTDPEVRDVLLCSHACLRPLLLTDGR